jgi:hypothetical protein
MDRVGGEPSVALPGEGFWGDDIKSVIRFELHFQLFFRRRFGILEWAREFVALAFPRVLY